MRWSSVGAVTVKAGDGATHRLVQDLADVADLHLQPLLAGAVAQVHHAGRALGDQGGGAGLGDVVHLPVQHAGGLLVVQEGVAAGRAAAPVGFGQLLVGQAGHGLQQLARLGGDLGEAVGEVAGIVVGDGPRRGRRGRPQADAGQVLAEAADLGREGRGLVAVRGVVLEQGAVFLEVGAAAAAVARPRPPGPRPPRPSGRCSCGRSPGRCPGPRRSGPAGRSRCCP